MYISKKVCLQPNKSQEADFIRFAGASRFAWNESKTFYEKMFREQGEYATMADLMKHLQDLKHNNPDYAWLNSIPEAITKRAMRELLDAYKKYFKERKKNKTFNSNKYKPNYKKRGKCKESFYQRTDKIHKTDDAHIKITGIKTPIKCKALKGVNLPDKIANTRITFDGKYWYFSYAYEVEPDIIIDFERDCLGIDVGIKEFAVFSNGQHFKNINKSAEICRLKKRLKRLQRQVAHKYEVNAVISKNKKIYTKTNNIKRLEQQIRLIYRRMNNIRKNHINDVINFAVRTKPRTIVIEDLCLTHMLQNHTISKTLYEESLYKFRERLTSKCKHKGIELILADRYYPSSKTCSNCGHIKKNLKLSERIYRCPVCDFVIDRDENAAINLENYKVGVHYAEHISPRRVFSLC